MLPPYCCICQRECGSERLVTFRETEAGRVFARRVEEEGITGHPPDAQWFCDEHYELVKDLTDLTFPEALQAMRRAR